MPLSRLLEPFLVKYQTLASVIPFLFDDVKSLLIPLCSKIVRPDTMAKEMSKKLCLLNFEENTNLLHVDQIDNGFAAKSVLK